MAPLTPQRKIVLDVLTAAAESGLPCPSDLDIAAALGITTAGGASRLVGVLAAMGVIEVENVANNRRVVTITATGASTARPPTREPRPPPAEPLYPSRRETVREMIALCAEKGLVCPTNAEFQKAIGAHSHSAIQVMLTDLRTMGVIEHRRARRVVTILATGATTAAPVLPAQRAKGHRANHDETFEARRLARAAERDRILGRGQGTPRPGFMLLPPAKTCQWPFGDAAPYAFCGKPSQLESSYCPEHYDDSTATRRGRGWYGPHHRRGALTAGLPA